MSYDTHLLILKVIKIYVKLKVEGPFIYQQMMMMVSHLHTQKARWNKKKNPSRAINQLHISALNL
jgi:hypothetical protein